MAEIMDVDYEDMPRIIKQMRTDGESLHAEMTKAYESIKDMHNVWYGQRYNELVNKFNSLLPKINELSKIVVGEIPFELEKIANNYADADKGSNVVGANKTIPNKIVDLASSNDKGMKFLTEEVTTTKTNVTTNFEKAKEKMNIIESSYKQIKWQSGAAEVFRDKFTKLKRDIIIEFDNIESLFTKLMEQALTEMQAAETKSTLQ